MNKDEQLQREFDRYVDGVAPPDNATDRAKKLIEKKARTRKAVRRFIPAFAATAAVCGVAVLAGNFIWRTVSDSDAPTSPAAPDNGFSYYTTAALTSSALDVYSEDLPTELRFIQKLEFASNISVDDVCAYTAADGQLTLVRADVRAVVNGYRHDTTVYVEYTQERTVYEPLKSFYDGRELYAADTTTLMSRTENNGEPVYNLLAYENDVRYYISVESADESAFWYYLSIL